LSLTQATRWPAGRAKIPRLGGRTATQREIKIVMDIGKFKLMMFDMDDTLINFSGSPNECWRNACVACSSQLGEINIDDLLQTIRKYADWYWSDPERHRVGRMQLEKTRCMFVTNALKNLGVDNEALGNEIGDAYTKERAKVIALFPETLQVLGELRKNKHMALVTNGQASMQREKIERFGLRGFFDCVVIEEEFGIGKPDERVFRYVLNEIGVDPYDACMVGDNLSWDVAGPQQLGIRGIWFDKRRKGLPADSQICPDMIINNLSELIN